MSLLRKVLLHDADGNAIGSLNNSLDVHDADAHHSSLSVHAVQDSGISENFGAGGASSGDSIFDVAAGQGGTFSVGNKLKLYEGSIRESDLVQVLNVSTDTLTIDRPLEQTYTASGVLEITEHDLAQGNGSVASPDIYEIAPPSGEIWHIWSITLSILDNLEPGVEKFGGIAALTNGMVVRQENSVKRNLVVFRTNGDMKEYFGTTQVEFIERVGAGAWSTYALWEYRSLTGSIIRLDGTLSESLKFIIQDNLTALSLMEIVGHGHKEE